MINPLALRAGFIELRGQRIALPGVSSSEPLVRGCDQRRWLERLAGLGIRHLVVPFNGFSEDTCLFSRRHPSWSAPAPSVGPASETPGPPRAKDEAVYDLAHRDEGVFARLEFLFEAAEAIGVILGLSIFHIGPSVSSGPLARPKNVQGAGLDDLEAGPGGAEAAEVEAALERAVDWIAAEVRGRQAVWVEVFRGLPRLKMRDSLSRLEDRLTRRLAQALLRPGDDSTKTKLGPWIVAPPQFDWPAGSAAHAAPFDVRRGVAPDQDETALVNGEAAGERRPALFYFATSDAKSGPRAAGVDRGALWRSALRGGWPIVPGGLSEHGSSRRWRDLAQLGAFARQWVERSYLRACPELLAPLPAQLVAAGQAAAGTDGCGRYFVYFADDWSSPGGGLTLATLPGAYRYYWFDLASGQSCDHGDGLEGGPRCSVPCLDTPREAVLILEQEELPDPLSVW